MQRICFRMATSGGNGCRACDCFGESPCCWGPALLQRNRPVGACSLCERHSPHDGVAVVNQPDGYGLHIYLETDTSFPGVCRPRWLPDPARLFNGNGSTPFSSGLATREEFFDAVARRDVRGLLKSELKALCQARAPEDRWQWIEPPRNEEAGGSCAAALTRGGRSAYQSCGGIEAGPAAAEGSTGW